jgi:predicted nucleic acid-binding protein
VPLIVDASVVVAWFARNQAGDYTDRIRRQARNQRLHVPAVWPLEFANALWQLQRRRLLSDVQVDTIIDLVEPLDIVVHGETLMPRRLVAVSRKHDLTAYDASYLDLALTLRYPVACRDGPLKGALRAAGAKLA